MSLKHQQLYKLTRNRDEEIVILENKINQVYSDFERTNEELIEYCKTHCSFCSKQSKFLSYNHRQNDLVCMSCFDHLD